jgi:hypothetical protein
LGGLPDELSYYKGFLDGLKVQGVLPEHKLAFNEKWEPVAWDAEDLWFRCILDALVLMPTQAIVYDWKTGKEYADHKSQREIYSVAVNAAHPELFEISALHVYVDSRQNSITSFHKDLMPALRQKWVDNADKMFSDTHFAPNPTFMCRYCAFSRTAGGPCPF